MQKVLEHNILSARAPTMTPRRAAIIGSVALLHVGAVYLLVSGMAARIIEAVPPPIIAYVDDKPVKPQPPTHIPVVKLVQPVVQPIIIPVPRIDTETLPPDRTIIATTKPPPATTNPPNSDTGAVGLMNTHTTPPYPGLAARAAHAGTVTLNIVVTPTGDVASATIAQSSGFAELDQAAIEWVTSHWKYKPAFQNGQAVAAQTRAAVKFDLTQARR